MTQSQFKDQGGVSTTDPSPPLRWISSKFMTRMADLRRRDKAREKAERNRAKSGLRHCVEYFHQVEDAYSQLAVQLLPELAQVSGTDLDLAAFARNRHPERASGMEARMGAEAGHLAARQNLTREQANEVVKRILDKYEDRFNDPPLGKRFDECYNLQTLQPTPEYLDLYEQIKEQLTGFGLDYARLNK